MTTLGAIPGAALAVIIASAAIALALGASYPLIDPDEGRNAEVAREMLASHDFVVPHLAGMPYLDKPPGLFWFGAAALALCGNTPLAARAPATVAAMLVLFLLVYATLRLDSRRDAWRTVALTAAAPLFLGLSAYVIFDMPLAACVTAVWALLAVELEHGSSPARRLGMFAALALGVLLKGPVMLAWAAGGSLAAAVLLRSRAPLRWLVWLPGWLLFAGVAGTWFGLALRRHPEYVRYAFLEESLERLTSGSFQREQPPWFVPAVLVGGTLPWSLATPWAWPRARSARVATGFVLFAAVFFTMSRSKLVTYLLPAVPALAWWAAECWRNSSPRRRRAAGLVLCVLFGGLAVAVQIARRGPLVPFSGGGDAAWRLFAALLVLFALAAVAAQRRSARFALAACAAFPPLLLLAAAPALQPYAASQSGAGLAAAVKTLPGQAILYENCYSPGTDFLIGRSGRVMSADGLEITSNYIVRYRDALAARGQWTPLAPGPPPPDADVLVRRARRAGEGPPPGWVPLYSDRRFVTYRRAALVP